MKNKRATLINIFAALITLGVQMFISFWLSPFVVGKLGEEAYGFINLANNFVSYASLVSVAINSMACRYISVEYNSGNKEKAKLYFCSVFIANCFLYGLILIVSILFVWKLEYIVNITAALVFQVKLTFLLSFVNMGTSLIGAVYTAAAFTTGEMHYNSIVQIVSNVIKSILIFTLFSFLPAKVYYLSLATLIAGIVTLWGNFKVTKKLFVDFDIDKNYFDFSKLKVLLKSGFWVLISNISNLLLNGLDLLFSNWFISSVIMGRLSLAKQIPLVLSNALGVFSNIFSSALTKVFASDGNNKLVDEANSQLKILTMFLTVPYAGIVVFGYDFLKLWLSDTSYTGAQFVEIYILMILALLDIIISTYMYSIHSIFIAIDKVRIYSVVLLVSSIISIATTLILLKNTGLGVYAIAGTSTVILGFTHGVIVPACAAKLLDRPIWTFWKTELRSWVSLAAVCIVFFGMKNLMDFPNWMSFFVNILIAGLIGYVLEFILVFNKQEKKEIVNIIEIDEKIGGRKLLLEYKNKDKMIFYSFWMTILIVVYHLAPHLIELSNSNRGYLRQFFETFGPIALNYFFAVSAYKFFVSEKPCGDKLKKRLITLIVPYIAWNTIYISLYILQNGLPNLRTIILGYTLTPFDGPLWYIFVLYIYLAFSTICVSRWPWLFKKLEWQIVILTFAAAALHHAVIYSLISFPYDWWVERTLRMAPPFLYGVYCSKHKSIEFGRHSAIVSMICLLISTILGDNLITTLLLYLCTLSLWNILPDFTLKADSIIKNDMFIVYSIHEGIIIVMLALLNKENIHFGKYSSLIFVILLETALIVTIGLGLNLIIRRLPAIINIMFTGGRNEYHSKEKKQY